MSRARGRRRRGHVEFRAEDAGDEGLVRRAHVAHRAASLARIGWPDDALARLCAQQHELQERHIAAYNPGADRRMIIADGDEIGRLCLDRTGVTWRIVDLVLLPQAQGRGHGSAALRLVLAEAKAAGATVDLMVGRDNPRADALYRRLGFVDAIDASATHHRLVWVGGGRPFRQATPDRRDDVPA